MTQALLTQYYNRACQELSNAWQLAKHYVRYDAPDAAIERTMTIDGVKHVLSGKAKELAVQQRALINRAEQLERISNVASGVIGVHQYHSGLWNQSYFWTVAALPIAIGVNKLAKYAIDQYFRPKADQLYHDMKALVTAPKQD